MLEVGLFTLRFVRLPPRGRELFLPFCLHLADCLVMLLLRAVPFLGESLDLKVGFM